MKTVEVLLKKYGDKHPPLVDVARDYLGITCKKEVYRMAAKGALGGIKAFKMRDSTKAPWLVDIEQVAAVLDSKSKQ